MSYFIYGATTVAALAALCTQDGYRETCEQYALDAATAANMALEAYEPWQVRDTDDIISNVM